MRARVPVGLALAVVAWACGGSATTATSAASVEVTPEAALLIGVGDTLRFDARVLDSTGSAVSGASVSWTSGDASVVAVDGSGLVTAAGGGTTTVSAAVDGVSGSASVEVYVPAAPTAYEPGTSYFGRRNYVEYVPGTLPLVVSAPHGGDLEPSEIRDRTSGTTVTDSNTREMIKQLRGAFLERTGQAPHIVISHLRRTKLDPNREIVEAAQGNRFAEQAWREFQGFIDRGTQAVLDQHDTGFYVDLHGHGHPIARMELGYLLSASDLEQSDVLLDAPQNPEKSSVRALWHRTDASFSALIRGPESLGGRIATAGLRAVPSPGEPHPGGEPYFTGGYNTARHGSQEDGVGVSGVQIELPFPGYRDTATNRAVVADRLARALEEFMLAHYGFFR